jgi:NADH:ubiquinone oxidoreductase subunit 2 (subunit N)
VFSIASVTYFILIYIFSNLAAFGVAAIISEKPVKKTLMSIKACTKPIPF